MNREKEQYEFTGRSASFYNPVETEQDIQAVAQRVAQFIMAGQRRGELDGVKVQIMEAETTADSPQSGSDPS